MSARRTISADSSATVLSPATRLWPAPRIVPPSGQLVRLSETRSRRFPCPSRRPSADRPGLMPFQQRLPGSLPYRRAGRAIVRSVLKLLEPNEIGALGVKAHSNQPDTNQTNRGTLFTRCWSGRKAPVVSPEMSIALIVQRDPDQGYAHRRAGPICPGRYPDHAWNH